MYAKCFSILREALAKLGEGEKDATLELTIKQLEVLADELVDAIKRSAVSSNLEEADNLRDDVLRRLNAILTGYAAFPASFSEKREAAEKLSAVFTKYGLKTALVPFAEEIWLLNSLIKEFESEELSALSAKVGSRERNGGRTESCKR